MPLSPNLLLLVPAGYLAAALAPDAVLGGSLRRRWRASLAAAAVAPLLALGAGLQLALRGAASDALPLGLGGTITLSTRLDGLTFAMLLLVTSIAAVILRFSRRYLGGEPGQARYLRWFMATMAAASLLVVTNNVLVLALAWMGSSLALHQLLTFYDERPAALVAAHKKFLLSRVADVAILGGVLLMWRATGTLEIDAMVTQAAALAAIPGLLAAGGLLLAAGVILRSAQLPFHGWLIQVMEAPTPVSALLHAGIVNIGGFVLIRLAGVMGRLDGAQTLLVVAGTLTAVLAGLVMTTRVSVKVALAWSTCAQMGFMLLECGLGAYGLALLHLVAHSLYKAHAFLASGRAVEQQLLRTMAPAPGRGTPAQWALAAVAGGMLVAAGLALGIGSLDEPGLPALAVILALALAPLFLRGALDGPRPAIRLAAAAAGLAGLYGAGHAFFGAMAPAVHAGLAQDWMRAGFVALAFLLLYAAQAAIATRPTGRFARALYPACFAGFYLDEIFTRLTFKVWPPRAVQARARTVATPTAPAMERAA